MHMHDDDDVMMYLRELCV